jgi:hypothetical protein
MGQCRGGDRPGPLRAQPGRPALVPSASAVRRYAGAARMGPKLLIVFLLLVVIVILVAQWH